MKKIQLGLVCMMVAVTAMAEQLTITGELKFSGDRRYYEVAGCTPELATSFKAEQFAAADMGKFTSGDKVKVVLDGARIRPDGKISPSSATIVSIEKAQ